MIIPGIVIITTQKFDLQQLSNEIRLRKEPDLECYFFRR